MDIDLPYILFWAVLVSGVIILVDQFFLRPARVAAHESTAEASVVEDVPAQPFLVAVSYTHLTLPTNLSV